MCTRRDLIHTLYRSACARGPPPSPPPGPEHNLVSVSPPRLAIAAIRVRFPCLSLSLSLSVFVGPSVGPSCVRARVYEFYPLVCTRSRLSVSLCLCLFSLLLPPASIPPSSTTAVVVARRSPSLPATTSLCLGA